MVSDLSSFSGSAHLTSRWSVDLPSSDPKRFVTAFTPRTSPCDLARGREPRSVAAQPGLP